MAKPKITFVDTVVVERARGELNQTGLILTNATRKFSGTPDMTGIFRLPVRATNNYGSDEEIVTLKIAEPQRPTLNGLAKSLYTGTSVSFRLSGQYTTLSDSEYIDYVKWSASGLPAGCSINPNTGYITGAPTTAGTYRTTVVCENNWGSGAAIITWYVTAKPATVTPKPEVEYVDADASFKVGNCTDKTKVEKVWSYVGHDHSGTVYLPYEVTSVAFDPNNTWVDLKGGRRVKYWAEYQGVKTRKKVDKQCYKCYALITPSSTTYGKKTSYATYYINLRCNTPDRILLVECSFKYPYYS